MKTLDNVDPALQFYHLSSPIAKSSHIYTSVPSCLLLPDGQRNGQARMFHGHSPPSLTLKCVPSSEVVLHTNPDDGKAFCEPTNGSVGRKHCMAEAGFISTVSIPERPERCHCLKEAVPCAVSAGTCCPQEQSTGSVLLMPADALSGRSFVGLVGDLKSLYTTSIRPCHLPLHSRVHWEVAGRPGKRLTDTCTLSETLFP